MKDKVLEDMLKTFYFTQFMNPMRRRFYWVEQLPYTVNKEKNCSVLHGY